MVSASLSNGTLDQIDKQILELLQEDGKITIREIAEKTAMSQTAIRSRIQKLEESLIKKYVAIIDCRRLGYREMVMASLRVNSASPIEKLKGYIEQMEKVKFAYVITGEYPLFIMAKCLDHNDSMSLIEKLRNLPGVEEVKTQIVLDRIKEDTTIIIP
jgi:Lrp/AsnC family transcriptional regulator for asnA, asnC and gidA